MRIISSLTIVAALAAPLAFPEQAHACSCMYYEDENERNATFYQNADVILQGIPVEVETYEENMQRTYRVSVEKVWKGQADAYVDIETHLHSATCGIQLELDARTIIFAYESENGLQTGLCSGTTSSDDESLVAWLNEGYENSSASSSSSSSSTEEFDCTPYYCANGDVFDACSADGTPINYLVAPCQFSGGEADDDDDSEVFDEFSDVPESHPNFSAIMFVRNEGIVEGYDGNVYLPDEYINRAEFTKIIVAARFAADDIASCEVDGLFTDVAPSDWFASFVCQAKLEEVLGGYPDGSFGPGNYVNFAEAAKIIVNAFGIETASEDHLSVWWKPYVFALARIGGLPSSFSDPNQQLTRGDMAEMIYRVMIGMRN